MQQDGDYYLTSLLLRPLRSKTRQRVIILTLVFVKQKKTFEFRGREMKSGDICVTYTIQLQEKPFMYS